MKMIIRKLKYFISLILINLFTVIAYADEVDIPIEEPKSLSGIIIAVFLAIVSAIFLLIKRNK